MSERLLKETQPASSSRVIAYEEAQVVPGIVNGTYFLVVSGQAPCMNMEVDPIPLIYVTCPEYWNIEIVGTLKGGFCLTAMRPYMVSIPLSGITGSKGVEIIGSNNTQQFEVAGGCS